MKVVITGGIGSGKSYVCGLLRKRGIEVYDCDAGAKRLMRSSAELQRQLSELVGADVYQNGKLQKRVLAKYILASEENAQQVDNVVHPAVARDFEASGYDWVETAILFESGFDKRIRYDKIVCVTAPFETRVERIMHRDGISREKSIEWINRQMPQDEVSRRSDYVIVNDGQADIDAQLNKILPEMGF